MSALSQPRFFYLHGWASSPASAKARLFQAQFAELGVPLSIPDLNQDAFQSLTLSRQIAQVAALLADDPAVLIGSSFGALTALWLAQTRPQVRGLLLLAPALNFPANIQRQLGQAGLAQWQANGVLRVTHHAWQREADIGWEFMADLPGYPEHALRRELPTLILHGRDDAVIPLADVQNFVFERPWIQLQVFADDHSLGGSPLWEAASAFLQAECGMPRA